MENKRCSVRSMFGIFWLFVACTCAPIVVAQTGPESGGLGGTPQFCQPGCELCQQVAPGRWERECLTPNCGTRTESCTSRFTIQVTIRLIDSGVPYEIDGVGGVTSNPIGINCSSICEASFSARSVTLFADVLSPNWQFASWSGDCSGTATSFVLSPTGASAPQRLACVASFTPKRQLNLDSGILYDPFCESHSGFQPKQLKLD